MPLSDHEQQLLDQLERQLHAEDPALARALDGSHAAGPRAGSRAPMRRLVLGLLVALVGLVGVLAGVATQWIPLGVLGFVVMGAGVLFATRRERRDDVARSGGLPGAAAGTGLGGRDRGRARSRAPRQRSSFMEKLEERWEDRRDGF